MNLKLKVWSLRLLPSGPDLVRTSSLLKVPGVNDYMIFSSFELGESLEGGYIAGSAEKPAIPLIYTEFPSDRVCVQE